MQIDRQTILEVQGDHNVATGELSDAGNNYLVSLLLSFSDV